MTFRPTDRTQRLLPNESWAITVADRWSAFGVSPEATGTLALVANTGVVTPVFVPLHTTMQNIGFNVTTAGAASTVARVALYEWNPVTKALGNLVADFGTTAVDATGIRSIAANGTTIRSGWYAWVIVSSGAPTVRTVLGSQSEQSEPLAVNTTNFEALVHYTCATFLATGVAAPASGAAATLTRVVSNSEFRSNNIILGQYVPSRIAV